MTIEYVLLVAASLLFVSVLASKASDKLGVPALLLFLLIGMIAGVEGLGGIRLADPLTAKSVGIVALAFIIFSGGLDTHWGEVRPILGEGLTLSTLGVIVTTGAIGVFAVGVLKFSLLEGLLLGAIVSSTDAAAVFSVLRSRHVGLKGHLKPLLEFESGSNDPMAVFLTLSLISLLTIPDRSLASLIPRFFLDMAVGALMGYVMPHLMLFIINRLRLEYEGLYPVLTLSLVLITYTLTTVLHGNGFLAVYMAGLIIGNSKFLHKKTLMRFHEGLAWLMQIAMFLTLGLMALPSRILPLLGAGILLSLFLILAARPLAVFLCLLPSKLSLREKTMVSWVGLRGAAPIILATFPLLSGIPQSHVIFSLVFFIVITSTLIQGTSIPVVARFLGTDVPLKDKRVYPIEFEEIEGVDANIVDLLVPYNSEVVGKTIFGIGIPKDSLVVLISKENSFIIPNGSTILEGGDVLLVLANSRDLAVLQTIIARQKKAVREDE
jgi:cell volume regulation protein A